MIEHEDVERVLRDIAREMPNTKNPWATRVIDEVEQQVCLYTDPDDTARHCIAGEVLARLELFVPGPLDTRSIDAVVDNEGIAVSHDALSLLADAQMKADGSVDDVVNPQSWGAVVETVLG